MALSYHMSKIIVISIKPDYVEKILSGTKKIELRKSTPNTNLNDVLVIYSTSPIKAIVGFCQVKSIIKTSPIKMWDLHSGDLGIKKDDFLRYYGDSQNAIGIVLGKTRRLKKKIPLETVKELFPNFTPPQTFKYFSLDVIEEKISFRNILGT